ncbi:hypothetical protein DDO07_17515, partial [Vibrio cholerae]|nr:hypothetical protein [Vibrio cholerae]
MENRKRLTKEDFIEKSRLVHGDKYQYEHTIIIDSTTTTTITCPEHGDFQVIPKNHYNALKTGCPNCKNYVKGTQEVFLARANEAHNYKYDYSKTEYISSAKKVIITCPKHGDFSVTPSQHYAPKCIGCPSCSGKKQLTNEEFINKSIEIHNNKYSYEKTNYVNSRENVTITCKEHGDFLVRASSHIGKEQRGCPQCAPAKKVRIKMDTETFRKLSKEVHGEKYDYSKSEYKNATTKITVTCLQHGDFFIRPNAHYGTQKQGCPSCGGRGKLDTKTFIERSRELFGNAFTYENTVYVNAQTKVTITCQKHGSFDVKPSNHFRGKGGCKQCGKRQELSTLEYVEKLKCQFGNRFDYSKVNYKGQHSLITISCPEHGEFSGKPLNLLRVKDCPRCIAYTQEDFIEAAVKIHEGEYSYDKVDYKTSNDFVTITCLKHGDFEQRPRVHLKGRGCPTCGVQKNLLSTRDPLTPT